MNKNILKLAIPNILSNISVPLLSTVDTILMGHLSMIHLGAIGLGSMVFNFIYWNFGFLRMGTTGMTAQAYGRESDEDISRMLKLAVFLALGLAITVLLLLNPFYDLMRYLLNVAYEQDALVFEYYRIRMVAAPATLCLYAMFGWFFGMQNAVIPMILTIFLNLVNIILSALLVLYFDWEIAGAAWGTVIAQYSGLALAFVFLYNRYKSYFEMAIQSFKIDWESMKGFLMVNRDIFLRTICLTSVFLFFYSQSSKAGLIVLGVNVVMLQFLNWMSYGVDGFAYAAESLVGRYYGANDDTNYFKAIKLSLLWGGVFAICYSLVYAIWGTELVEIFTDDDTVILASIEYLNWMLILPIVGFACYIWDGIYIGQTASRSMFHTMLLSFLVFFIVYYGLGGIESSAHNIWIAMMVFLALRGVLQSLYFVIKKKALR